LLEITARTLAISGTATLLAALVWIPLGCLIHFSDFRGKRFLVSVIQTFYSVPTVFIGLLVFMAISRDGPLGFVGILFTPWAMIIGQMLLIGPIVTGLTISALSGVAPEIRDTAVSLGASRSQTVRTSTAIALGVGEGKTAEPLALGMILISLALAVSVLAGRMQHR
jgi:tungstate transport system permease protein